MRPSVMRTSSIANSPRPIAGAAVTGMSRPTMPSTSDATALPSLGFSDGSGAFAGRRSPTRASAVPANNSSDPITISQPAGPSVTSAPGTRSSEVRNPMTANATSSANREVMPTPVRRAHGQGAPAAATASTAATTPIHEPPATSM
jgi:hypothetical protein